MRPHTRKTCCVPPAFILLKEREKGERESGEQRGELSKLPTRTEIFWMLHVTSLSTHWKREYTALSDRPDNKVQARIHLLKESLHPSGSPSQRSRCEYCKVLEPTNPQFFQIQKSNWELKLVFAFGFPWRSPQLRETRGTNSGPPCRFNISGRKYGWCIRVMQFCCHGLMFIPANTV